MAPLTVFLLHSSKVWEFLAVNKRDHSPNTKRGLVVFLVFLSFYFPCSYVYHSEKRRHSGPTGDTPGKPDEKTSKSRSTSGSSQKSLFNFAPPVSFNIYKKCTHWNLCTGSLEVRRGGVYWLTLRIFYFFFRNLPKKADWSREELIALIQYVALYSEDNKQPTQPEFWETCATAIAENTGNL